MAKQRLTEIDPRFETFVKLLAARIAAGRPVFGPDPETQTLFIKDAATAATLIHREAQSLQWIPGPDDVTTKNDQALDICRRLKGMAMASRDQPEIDKEQLIELFKDVVIIV